MILLLTIILCLFLVYLYVKTSKPPNFPPGPTRYPILGSVWYFQKLSIFNGIIRGQSEFGDKIGFYLGDQPAVILTKYEDIKSVFDKESVSHRPPQNPAYLIRNGWETAVKCEPILNKHRCPGVIMSNVSRKAIRSDKRHHK